MIGNRVLETQSPPLVELGQIAKKTKDCISLGQGAPFYHPPEWIFEEFGKLLSDHKPHRYSPDPGIEELRRALSEKLDQDNRINAPPDSIIVTPGANQAFFNILLTITDPGDEIILLGPYYFNHRMAATMTNVLVQEIPIGPDFTIPLEHLSEQISSKTKGLVLVNPGNPTGAVHTQEEIKMLQELSSDHDIWLISDETYEYFTYGNTTHHPLATGNAAKVITLGSFSKSYGIPGWRLGYYQANQELIDQSLKVQDTIGICAPHPSQLLGTILLKYRSKLVPKFVQLMEQNHRLAHDLLSEIDWLETTPSQGAYYLFPRTFQPLNTLKVARKLILEAGVYLVPGDGFGKAGKNHFRISFANVSQEGLKEAFSRLRSYS